MKYIKLTLVGYKRLLLKSIHHFEITPTTPIQVILGTNGSGKSSIMQELSPLPAVSSDFVKGGYKEIVIEHGGDTYTLRNSFGEKETHLFEVNGVNLNEGRRITAQTELVKQKFRYTSEIHDFITGLTKFTNMGTMVRRHWLTMFSNTDYDYAIKVYNKVAERYRDISGTLKTLKRRLVSETEKVVSAEEQTGLEKNIDELHSSLTYLLELRKPLDIEPELAEDNLKKSERVIEEIAKQLISIKLKLPDYGFTDEESIESLIREAQVLYRSTSQLSEGLVQEHQQVSESIQALKKTNEQGIEELSLKLVALTDKQAELANSKDLFKDIHESPRNALSALESVSGNLLELISNLPNNSNRYFSRETINKVTLELQVLLAAKDTLNTNIADLTLDKKHQDIHRDSKETVCPNCTHHWLVGFDPERYEKVSTDIEKTSVTIHINNKAIEDCQRRLDEIRSYFVTYKSIMSVMDGWSILSSLWNYIKDNLVLLDNPSGVEYLFSSYRNSLLIDVEYVDLFDKINQTKELITIASTLGNKDLNGLHILKAELEDKLQIMSVTIHNAQKDAKKYSDYKSQQKQINQLQTQLEACLPKHSSGIDELLEANRRKLFNQAIRVVQSNLSRKELAISEIRGQRSIIADIENQIFLLQKDEQALSLLVKELSPKEGLIAEGLFGFIDIFLAQSNKLMSTIFTYKFEMLPCKLDDDEKVELDYKFPVAISTNDTPIPDISKTSKGQKEIIDLTFVIMGMKHLGLDESPLMLDEFGANLDSTHRINATNMVKHLMEQHPFTQLFMVNHYDTIYGAFTNAQTTVLCDENVVIPKGCVYNQHVIIK